MILRLVDNYHFSHYLGWICISQIWYSRPVSVVQSSEFRFHIVLMMLSYTCWSKLWSVSWLWFWWVADSTHMSSGLLVSSSSNWLAPRVATWLIPLISSISSFDKITRLFLVWSELGQPDSAHLSPSYQSWSWRCYKISVDILSFQVHSDSNISSARYYHVCSSVSFQ